MGVMKRVLSWFLAFALLLVTLPALPTVAQASASEKALILPNGLEEIEESAFEGNGAITTVVVPNTVTKIGSMAFKDCAALSAIAFGSEDIDIADDAFDGCPRDLVFTIHSGSPAELYAISHGFKSVSIDEDANYSQRFNELLAYSGFDTSILMSDEYASQCLIVRTPSGSGRLPDISQYHPSYIFRSEADLFFIQFSTEEDTRNCFLTLKALEGDSIQNIEVDHAGDSASGSRNVAMASWWGTSDPMGFTTYGKYVNDSNSGSVTVAVVDSGVNSWDGGTFQQISFADGSGNANASNHATNIAQIISDCVGVNRNRINLLSVKVLNSGSIYRTTTIIQGIKYAAENADIINMSLGIDAESPEIKYQIDKASRRGVLFVAAAGNGTVGNVLFPARYDKVLAVSALSYSQEDGYQVRSRTGSAIDFTAPGMKLAISTNPSLTSADDTLGLASTSYATPQITAALALIKLDATKAGENPVNVLASCCDTLNEEGKSSAYGYGLPRLERLAIVNASDINLSNADGGDIPTRMWTNDTFLLTWNIVPENVTNKSVKVTTDNAATLGVTQYGSAYALISAKAPGTGTITVTTGDVVREIEILVEQPVTSISITGAVDKLVIGRTLQLGALVGPANAKNKSFTWRSSNPAVATISATGLVTALGEGPVRITAEADDGYGTSAYADINVISIPDAETITIDAAEMDISSRSVSLLVDETLTLNWQIMPEDAPQDVTFTAMPAGVVSVSEYGVIRALAPGQATIVVTASTGRNVMDYLSVAVKIVPSQVTVNAPLTTLDVGGMVQMTATVAPSDATDKTIVWESSDISVATVTDGGFVTAVGSGTARITARTVNGKEDSVTITVRKPIVVSLNANGGTADEESVSGFAGYAIGTLPSAARAYYDFAGWYTAANGGTRVTDSSTFENNATIYAHWTPHEYTVLFDANDEHATCDTASMTARVDTPLGALPEPVRDGYAFVGWYTTASGDGQKVTSSYTQPTDDELPLFARWSAKPFNIVLNPNGGVCDTESVSAEVDAPVGNLPQATRVGYTFVGWFTESGDEVDADYTQSTDQTLRVYAHWTPNNYTVSLDANGGECAVSEVTGTVDAPIGMLPDAERPYYTFVGWFTEEDLQVTESYQQGTDDDFTVVAHWTPNTYDIILNGNGGTCNATTAQGTVGEAIGNLPGAVRPYYQFAGWFDGTGANANEVTANYAQETDDSVTFYAHWTPNSYTMYFDVNAEGATCDTESIEGLVATPIGDLPVPTRESYRFDGWFTSRSSDGELVSSQYERQIDDDITVYAHWTLLEYTVTFDVNAEDASCSTASMVATASIALGTLPTPTRDYYTFQGWYTAEGALVTADYVQATATPLTLFAHWSLNPESGWVLPSEVPSGAQITDNKWRYRETTESTSSSLSGWTNSGNYWKQTGSGSVNYSTQFPGGFNTSHWIYTNFNKSALSSYENATNKRTVSDGWGGYVYWHWMYNVAYANNTGRMISSKKGTFNANGGSSNGFAFSYFYAFTSGTAAPYLDNYYCCSQNLPSYNCVNILPSGFPTNSTGGVGTPRFFRFEYRVSYYTDYTKYYQFYRYLESSSAVNVGGNITEVTKYVKYRAK